MKKLILILLILPIQAQADFIEEYGLFEPFDTVDWVMQGVFTTLVYIDARQTKRFVDNGGTDGNPTLGKNPSHQKIDNLIFLGAASHALISWALPEEFRPFWQGCFIMIEAGAVSRNRHMNNKRGSHDVIVVVGFEF